MIWKLACAWLAEGQTELKALPKNHPSGKFCFCGFLFLFFTVGTNLASASPWSFRMNHWRMLCGLFEHRPNTHQTSVWLWASSLLMDMVPRTKDSRIKVICVPWEFSSFACSAPSTHYDNNQDFKQSQDFATVWVCRLLYLVHTNRSDCFTIRWEQDPSQMATLAILLPLEHWKSKRKS